jgi:SAM-dependent methyltransferase
MGYIGSFINKFMFENNVNKTDILMDFGCGGGYLLDIFENKTKFGFEINKSAIDECNRKNIKVFDNFNDIENDSIDCIISHHAIEHVPLPLDTLKNLYTKLKPGGKIIIVIPCEQPSEESFYYKPNDINQHLHTWCPMTFGNLVTLSGFNVIECIAFQHKWTPNYPTEYKDHDYHKKCMECPKDSKLDSSKLSCICNSKDKGFDNTTNKCEKSKPFMQK